MSFIDKLVGLATVGSAVANTTVLHRVASGLTGILALTMIASLIGGALLIAGFYGVYLGLVYYGLNPYAAAVTVALLTIATLAILLLLLAVRLRHLKELSHYEVQRDLPGMSQIVKVVDAFMEGLLTPRSNSHK
jgi:hypothetical protein